MARHLHIALAGFVVLFILLVSFSQPILASSNGADQQTPNNQILNPSTPEYNQEAFYGVTTAQAFDFNNSGIYSTQLNAIVNGCTYGESGCLWWVQTVADLVNGTLVYDQASGAYTYDAFISYWIGGNWNNVCGTGGDLYNIDQAGATVWTFTVFTSSGWTTGEEAYSPSGVNEFTTTASCPYPSGYTVSSFNTVEGVVVGQDGGLHTTFSPLNSLLFKTVLTLYGSSTSDTNTRAGTQTGESSNLIQNVTSVVTGNPYLLYASLYSWSFLQQVVSVSTSGGVATDPSYIVGSPGYPALGSPAKLGAGNSGDSATIIAGLGAKVSGTLQIYGYSYDNGDGAYYSYMQVSVSSNDKTWTVVYSGVWNPSSTNSPSWIRIASVTDIAYVKVYTTYYDGDSAKLYLYSVDVLA